METEINNKVWKCLSGICSHLEDVNENTNLFEEAVLDSIATLEFIQSLELEFDMKLDDAIMFNDNFATVQGIVTIISETKK
tara:strand:+ start:161 stop:403 length:243 start_codon:yes stop_codon:yes gene_type:complete